MRKTFIDGSSALQTKESQPSKIGHTLLLKRFNAAAMKGEVSSEKLLFFLHSAFTRAELLQGEPLFAWVQAAGALW